MHVYRYMCKYVCKYVYIYVCVYISKVEGVMRNPIQEKEIMPFFPHNIIHVFVVGVWPGLSISLRSFLLNTYF